jgi:hypothetical protein
LNFRNSFFFEYGPDRNNFSIRKFSGVLLVQKWQAIYASNIEKTVSFEHKKLQILKPLKTHEKTSTYRNVLAGLSALQPGPV